MLTADNITDKEIRSLLDSPHRHIRVIAEDALVTFTDEFSNSPYLKGCLRDRKTARARCAEILNARGVK